MYSITCIIQINMKIIKVKCYSNTKCYNVTSCLQTSCSIGYLTMMQWRPRVLILDVYLMSDRSESYHSWGKSTIFFLIQNYVQLKQTIR